MLFKKKMLLAKMESAYSTDSSPDGSNAIVTKGVAINVQQGNRVTRDLDRPTLGNDEEKSTSMYTTLEFETELAGSGTAGTAPGFGVLLRACAMSETVDPGVSVTYEPVSDNFESITLHYVQDGILYAVPGCRGSVSVDMSKDQLPMLKFSFTGLHRVPVETSSVTPAPVAFAEAIAVTAQNTPTYTLDSYDLKAEAFSMDLANTVVYRNVVNSESVQITDRAPAGSVSFEMPKLSQKNYLEIAESGDKVPLEIVHGVTAGNITTITAANTQLSQPARSDSDGILALGMNARFIPTSAGDDELSLAFS